MNNKLFLVAFVAVVSLLLMLALSHAATKYALAQDLMSANESLYFNGHGEASREYSNYLAANADTGFNGAPHSMNYHTALW